MGSALAWILLAVLAALLLAACWCDLRARTIPNGLNLAVALLAVPFWWSLGLAFWPDVALHLGVAALVFALFAIAFALGAMGGGDVKLVAAIALWLPYQSVLALLFLMSVAGGALTLFMLIRHKLARRTEQLEIPYGLAIAFGGLWLISERFLNQFG
ncbi:MAG: prepilin peptidase [Sphingomonadaceae bacterium]|nr:prepilin peptidase [Sphingomonadaceae bacterium]